MYKLKFTLKQHTPLIHFQWEQAGATLRPTELKSKLDKWILQHKTNFYGPADELLKLALTDDTISHWIKGTKKKDHPALNYIVSVCVYGENSFINEINPTPTTNRNGTPILDKNDYPLFFGNQLKYTGNASNPKEEFLTGVKRVKRLSYYPTIIVTIDSVNDTLLKNINEEFPLFLLHTNFGTRQSKGFGSFYIDKNDKSFPITEDGKIDEGYFKRSFDYCFDITTNGNRETDYAKDLFSQIDIFYKSLRGGISPNDKYSMYFKSLMWKYAKSKDSQWEKKNNKTRIFFITRNSSKNKSSREGHSITIGDRQKGKYD